MKNKFLVSTAGLALIASPAVAQTKPVNLTISTMMIKLLSRLPMLRSLIYWPVLRRLSVKTWSRTRVVKIGETLTKLPGVSATSFAPGSSRPVLRGFQGVRVRVLTDGIGTLDASNTSADHAVPIDTLTAQSVEVLRGPAVLCLAVMQSVAR